MFTTKCEKLAFEKVKNKQKYGNQNRKHPIVIA